MMIESNDIYHPMIVQVLKKFAGPEMGQLGPKRGQNEVLGHFLVQNVLVFGDFAHDDRKQ